MKKLVLSGDVVRVDSRVGTVVFSNSDRAMVQFKGGNMGWFSVEDLHMVAPFVRG